MQYSHDDAELAGQPIGYWAWAAHTAAVTHIRAGLARHGLSQPQWWVLNQLVGHADGRDRAEVTDMLKGYLDVGADGIGAAVDALLGRGLAAADGDRLHITAEGADLHARCAALQKEMRATLHDGISDEEYVRTLKVLQRMIHNVDGKMWHH
ncbi:transcriptional regulator [Streptomyces sp. NRRL F-5755]|uniref:MarR family winged helix-turn-helix transcriptional regulator n=1 Tax=Streptomyces sp. NRRL F-5755 TaxID=1519475 RepID=UPI0006B0182C|nr:MarR family winged helix-turn-helix transcriptional regulator [Streptomyces sp. NRRL F-5755]KOU07347.1 transcriptional regulator [Streptomyces sp. NRRL F-5755]